MASASEDQAQLALTELAGLLVASRRLTGLLDAAMLSRRAAHEARLLVGTEIAAVALVEDPTLLVMRGTSGTRTAAISKLRIPRGTGLGGKILLERRPISVVDYAQDHAITRDLVDVVADGEGLRGLVGVPIEDQSQVLGILYGGLRAAESVGQLLFGISVAARRAQKDLKRTGDSAVLLAVVREGLHNVAKYACASTVFLTLYYATAEVGIAVQDDGLGLPTEFVVEPLPRGGHRLGLSSLLQRAQRLGGALALILNGDRGVTLRVSLPLEVDVS